MAGPGALAAQVIEFQAVEHGESAAKKPRHNNITKYNADSRMKSAAGGHILHKKCPNCGSVVVIRLDVTRVRCINYWKPEPDKCNTFLMRARWLKEVDA